MKSELIVMISGGQGSGKTTLMKELTENLELSDYTVFNVIFADTIYKIHDFTLKLLEQRGVVRDIVKDGRLLQLLGTEWGRNTVDENIWVKTLLGQITQITRENSGKLAFIVSDCRFRNEFDGIPEAFKVRLEASKEVRKSRCSQWRDTDTHISETDLNGYAEAGAFDCYVDTEGNLDACVAQISVALGTWLQGVPVETPNGFEHVKDKYYKHNYELDLQESASFITTLPNPGNSTSGSFNISQNALTKIGSVQ